MKSFFDAKEEKITEKAFSQGLIISIVSILLCIVVLCSMTYAWFSADVSSSTNTLGTGHFSVDVDSVTYNNNGTEQNVVADGSGIYILDEGTYRVTVELTAATTVKGYCIITVNGTKYHTDVIVNEQTKNDIYTTPNSPFEFELVIPAGGATVTFDSRWGIPAFTDVTYGGTLTHTEP